MAAELTQSIEETVSPGLRDVDDIATPDPSVSASSSEKECEHAFMDSELVERLLEDRFLCIKPHLRQELVRALQAQDAGSVYLEELSPYEVPSKRRRDVKSSAHVVVSELDENQLGQEQRGRRPKQAAKAREAVSVTMAGHDDEGDFVGSQQDDGFNQCFQQAIALIEG